MSNVAKLKKQAAELELKKQFDKALAIYVKLLDSFDQNADELDVALFNRVGDLMLRQGSVADAVDYYEKAVDRYADTGFFNNAIALCNKILRHSPGRASVYYKLGKISAQKGFKNDAKVNFLEYADRMHKAGKAEEAFRALKEFADLCPDQDEIRLMLADQLTKAGKKNEAIEQLQTLYERYDSEGRTVEAQATADRVHALDPDVELRSAPGTSRNSTSGDLIFLDLDAPSPPMVPRETLELPRATTPLSARPTVISSLIDAEPVLEELIPGKAPRNSIPIELTRIGDDTLDLDPSAAGSLLGLESTRLGDDSAPTMGSGSLLEFDATALDGVERSALDGLESTSLVEPEPARKTPHDSGVSLGDLATPFASRTPTEGTPSAQATPAISMTPLGSATPPASLTPVVSGEAVHDGAADAPLDLILSFDTTTPAMASEPVPEIRAQTPVDTAATNDVELILPEANAEAEAEAEPEELPPPGPMRPTPRTARAALEGLPVMDFEGSADRGATPAMSADAVPDEAEHPSLSELSSIEEAEAEDARAAFATPFEAADAVVDEPETAADAPPTGTDTDEEVEPEVGAATPTPAGIAGRRSTIVAAHSAELLRASVDDNPDDWGLRRQFAEALLDAGDRVGGIKELETAMSGAEKSPDLDLASAIAEEIARLEPEAVRHHQKRVEYAFRTSDRPRLIEAYLGLADALLRSDQPDKSRAVYQRVLDLAPGDMRARAALDTTAVPPPEPPPLPAGRASTQRRQSPEQPAPAAGDDFVNLGDWLRDEEAPKDTRMVVAEEEPTGDEDADFADMLKKFKQGVAENVDAEDYQSHYDLAIAFKEMGLLDEAIAEFQKALGSPKNRVPTYEALGQCFIEKNQFKLASSILGRALTEGLSDDKLIGVLYLMGLAAEALGNMNDALLYYQRVFIIDIQFRDIADRLSNAEQSAQ
ncbi:MAG: tetratricopeptide repeat protein [Gemmatimonadaceae bacterium]